MIQGRRMLFRMLYRTIVMLTFAVGSVLAADPFVVAVNNNDRPFCWTNERGELTGFSVEIARAICRTMQSDCRFTATTFADFLPGVVDKRFDFVVANVLRTAEREKQVDFTNRFWRSSSMFVGRAGAMAEITPQTAKGQRIGVQKGSVQEKFLLEKFAEVASVASFATNVERNNALVAGKVDLIFGSTVSHYAFLSTPEGARFDFIGGPIDGQGLGGDVAIPVAKGREELRKRLNAAIETILSDGTFARINNAYFPASVF